MQQNNNLEGGALFSFDKFEYDPKKSASNKEKHGIDFEEAKALWLDDNAVQAMLNYEDELRYFVIGKIGDKLWTAICTDRGVRIRIISVRRSHKAEEMLYENS